MYLGSWKIDDVLTFTCNTHTPSTGAVTDADAVPTYRVYEDETGTPILTGSTAKLDDAGTTGYYSEQITLSAANGLEKGKTYTIRMSATVGGVTGAMSHTFQIEAEVDANIVSDKTGFGLAADQSAVTVGTVALVTTTTTNTDMRGTDSAALAATALTDVTWTDAKAAFLNHSIATVDTNVDTLLTRITAAVALASALATAQTDLDTITGTDGVTLATAQALYAPNKVVPDVAGTAAGLHTTTDGKVDGLNNISSANVTTACTSSLTTYDPPTRAEATTDKNAIITEVNANETKIDALNNITVADIKAGIADGTYDLEEMMRLIFSSCCAKVSGGGTTTITFRDGPDSKDRITATVDENGNRTATTLDGST